MLQNAVAIVEGLMSRKRGCLVPPHGAEVHAKAARVARRAIGVGTQAHHKVFLRQQNFAGAVLRAVFADPFCRTLHRQSALSKIAQPQKLRRTPKAREVAGEKDPLPPLHRDGLKRAKAKLNAVVHRHGRSHCSASSTAFAFCSVSSYSNSRSDSEVMPPPTPRW